MFDLSDDDFGIGAGGDQKLEKVASEQLKHNSPLSADKSPKM